MECPSQQYPGSVPLLYGESVGFGYLLALHLTFWQARNVGRLAEGEHLLCLPGFLRLSVLSRHLGSYHLAIVTEGQ